MSTHKAKFKKVLPNKNVFTPDVLRYGQQGDYVYELSTGVIQADEYFGVTVVDLRTNDHRSDLSKLCDSYSEANNYINDLEKQK